MTVETEKEKGAGLEPLDGHLLFAQAYHMVRCNLWIQFGEDCAAWMQAYKFKLIF